MRLQRETTGSSACSRWKWGCLFSTICFLWRCSNIRLTTPPFTLRTTAPSVKTPATFNYTAALELFATTPRPGRTCCSSSRTTVCEIKSCKRSRFALFQFTLLFLSARETIVCIIPLEKSQTHQLLQSSAAECMLCFPSKPNFLHGWREANSGSVQ